MNLRSLIYFTLVLLVHGTSAFGQMYISRQAAIDSALKNNPQILGARENIERQKALKKGSVLIDKTEFWFESPTATRFALGIQQYFSFPGVYVNEFRLQKHNIRLAENEFHVNAVALKRRVGQLYLDLQYSYARIAMLQYQDSIYGRLFRSTDKRYSVGDASYLEKVLEETKSLEVKNLLFQEHLAINAVTGQLGVISGIATDSIITDSLNVYDINFPMDTSVVKRTPVAGLYQTNITVAQYSFRVQRAMFFPNLFVGYLNQGDRNSAMLYRLRLGVALPLWFPSYTSRIKGARIGVNVAELQYKTAINDLQSQYVRAVADLNKNRLNLNYYQQTALKQSDEIIRSSTILYNSGEISYFAYLQGLSQAMNIKMAYLDALKNYNISVIEVRYLLGQ